MTPVLYALTEGDYLVRGTQDLDVVKALVEDDHDFCDAYFDLEYDWEVKLDVKRTGLFRFNPCNCGEHGWDLGYATKTGRGVFEGVYFEARVVEVVFETDLASA